MRRAPVVVLLLFALASCAAPELDAASSSESVVGGYFDEGTGPTVGIFRCDGACAFTPYLNPIEICSGTLIGPNLVLTARHCVAPQLDADSGVRCSNSTFSSPFPPDEFIITPAKDVLAGGPWYIAREVDVPGPDGDKVCGNDVAVLHLRDPYLGATPMVPRLAAPPVPKETYSAIGYGDDLDGGIGYRHRRDGLTVTCVGIACPLIGQDLKPAITATEFQGQTGLCGGDSGGPAVDGAGLLFGVTSRANATACDTPIYSRIDSHAVWLKEQAAKAATYGSYELPAWAYAALPADAGADALPPNGRDAAPNTRGDAALANPAQPTGGCGVVVGVRGGGGSGSGLGAGLLLLLRLSRKRSRSNA